MQNILIMTGATIGIILLGTLYLPKVAYVKRTKFVEASPNKVYELFVSNKNYQKFNPYLSTDPKLKIDLFGPEKGVGSGFNFDGKEGKGHQVIDKIKENELIVYQIDLGAMGKPVQMVRLSASNRGTEISWEMTSDLGYNPIKRVFGLFLNKIVGSVFERGLKNISLVLEKEIK